MDLGVIKVRDLGVQSLYISRLASACRLELTGKQRVTHAVSVNFFILFARSLSVNTA
jgi:hypothetical protein